MRARRRQAQRSRQCRLHRASPHLLRDARQFLLRRLFQGARHPARLGAAHQGFRARPEAAADHRVRRRRRGGQAVEQDRRHSRIEKIIRIAGSDNFWSMGDHRPVRPVLGDFLRSWTEASGRPARQPRRRTATASSRSGISCSCNTSSLPAASASTCRIPRSTPAWGSSASPRCCKAPTTITPSICSAR